MTAASTALPLVGALAIAILVTSVHRRLPPRLAARFVVVALVVVAIAAIPTTLVIAIAFLAHAPLIGIGFEWCAQAIGLHGSMPSWIGVPAVALILIGSVRTTRLLRQHRQHRQLRIDETHPVHIAHSHTPYAVTLPGRAGQIVMSTAMVELLDETEQRIVVAHERAHARYRHDRYLLVAELVAAALPPLRALSKRVSYSIERWADEAAASVCGDRQLVAITLGRVALQASAPTVAGFSGLGVASRMSALLEPPVRMPSRRNVLMLWSTLAVTAGLSLYQLHHLEQLLTALCPH